MNWKYIRYAATLFFLGLGIYNVVKSGYLVDGITDMESMRRLFSGVDLLLASLIVILFSKYHELSERISRLEGGPEE